MPFEKGIRSSTTKVIALLWPLGFFSAVLGRLHPLLLHSTRLLRKLSHLVFKHFVMGLKLLHGYGVFGQNLVSLASKASKLASCWNFGGGVCLLLLLSIQVRSSETRWAEVLRWGVKNIGAPTWKVGVILIPFIVVVGVGILVGFWLVFMKDFHIFHRHSTH